MNHGHSDWRDWFRELYENTSWDKIKKKHRWQIIRLRLKIPDVCPSCGALDNVERFDVLDRSYEYHKFWLCSISRKWLDDDTDYEYLCPKCGRAKYYPSEQKPGECFHGQNLKPWSELKRRARVARIQKVKPMPGSCQYCDNRKVELVSRSGVWPEDDLSDYVWVCRSHSVMIEHLHPAKDPEPVIVNEPANPEMFPWWYNNTMAGTFKGSNILNLNCAVGRFL